MPKYKVYFQVAGDVRVDLESSFGPEDYDEVIEQAYSELPPEICGHCTGYRQRWTREIGEPEAFAVEDENGKTVWEEKANA